MTLITREAKNKEGGRNDDLIRDQIYQQRKGNCYVSDVTRESPLFKEGEGVPNLSRFSSHKWEYGTPLSGYQHSLQPSQVAGFSKQMPI